MSTTMVGMFATESQARDAMQRLQAEGIPREMMQLNGEAGYLPGEARIEPHEPERGPISRFFHNLFGGDDNVDAANYAEASRRGHGVLSVTLADESHIDHVSAIMDDCGAVDIDEHVAQWTASGYSSAAPGTTGALGATAPGVTPTLTERDDESMARTGANRTADMFDDQTGERMRQPMASDTAAQPGYEGLNQTMREVEEELRIGKRTVGKGGVRVIQRTMQTPVEQQVTLRDEQAIVDRRPVDRAATDADMQNAFQDRDIELRESREEPVVAKDARVVGEVEVGKKTVDHTETVRDTVRSSKVDVEPIEVGGERPARTGMAVPVGESRYSGPDRRVTFKDGYTGPERRRAAQQSAASL